MKDGWKYLAFRLPETLPANPPLSRVREMQQLLREAVANVPGSFADFWIDRQQPVTNDR